MTGATGFIGRRLVRLLEADGWTVTVGARSRSHVHECSHLGATVYFDLCETGPIHLPEGIDTIFHLAGKAHELSALAQDEQDYDRVNTQGTRRLLEAARCIGVRAFILFSSIKAAGPPPSGAAAAIDESYDAPPETAYGRSKRAAERLLLEGNYVPHAVALRPALVYGPGVKGNFQKMATAVRARRFPPLPECGNRRSMVHVDDVCRAAIAAATSSTAKGQTYILTDGAPVSTRQLFLGMCEAVGRPAPRWTIPLFVLRALGRFGDGVGRTFRRRFVFDSLALAKLTESAWYSSARIERELGWQPRHTLRGSLAEMIRD